MTESTTHAVLPSQSRHGVTSTITEARILNGDMRCHIKNSNFSSVLTGRFYKNNSMQSYVAKKRRISQMKSKRDELEKASVSEDEKILEVVKILREMRRLRHEAVVESTNAILEKGATGLQSLVRRRNARTIVARMNEDKVRRDRLVLVLQSRYRGWEGRKRAGVFKKDVETNVAAVLVQSIARRNTAKEYYSIERRRKQLRNAVLKNESATRIETNVRGYLCRKKIKVLSEKQNGAATRIQSLRRGTIGRRIATSTRSTITLDSKKRRKVLERNRSKNVNNGGGPRRPFVAVGVPRDITAASLVKASLFNRSSSGGGTKGNYNNKSNTVAVIAPDPCFVRSRVPPITTTNVNDNNSTVNNENDVVSARQKAAARVAGVQNQMRRAKNKVIAEAKATASRVTELEVKRKKSLTLADAAEVRRRNTIAAVPFSLKDSEVNGADDNESRSSLWSVDIRDCCDNGDRDDVRDAEGKNVRRKRSITFEDKEEVRKTATMAESPPVGCSSRNRDENQIMPSSDVSTDRETTAISNNNSNASAVTRDGNEKECTNGTLFDDTELSDLDNQNTMFDASFEEDFEESENDLEMLL